VEGCEDAQHALLPKGEAHMDEVQAPFTDDQIAALTKFQRAAGAAAMRCEGTRHQSGSASPGFDHSSGSSPAPVLVAVREGWICPDPACRERTYWAPASLLRAGMTLAG
jgi:hypothetical protein